MKNVLTIIKKELRRFFTDRRMLLSLILPGLIIFLVYSVMGEFVEKQSTVAEDYKYEIVIVNYDNNLDPYFGFLTPETSNITSLDDINNEYFNDIKEKKLDIYVVYPDIFYLYLLNYVPCVQVSGNARVVKIYYDSTKVE